MQQLQFLTFGSAILSLAIGVFIPLCWISYCHHRGESGNQCTKSHKRFQQDDSKLYIRDYRIPLRAEDSRRENYTCYHPFMDEYKQNISEIKKSWRFRNILDNPVPLFLPATVAKNRYALRSGRNRFLTKEEETEYLRKRFPEELKRVARPEEIKKWEKLKDIFSTEELVNFIYMPWPKHTLDCSYESSYSDLEHFRLGLLSKSVDFYLNDILYFLHHKMRTHPLSEIREKDRSAYNHLNAQRPCARVRLRNGLLKPFERAEGVGFGKEICEYHGITRDSDPNYVFIWESRNWWHHIYVKIECFGFVDEPTQKIADKLYEEEVYLWQMFAKIYENGDPQFLYKVSAKSREKLRRMDPDFP